MKRGVLTVAENPPSDVTSPLTLTPFGSAAFWSWASAGRPVKPITSKLAAAAINVLVIIGALPGRRCEVLVVGSTRRLEPARPSPFPAHASPGHAEASRGSSRMSRLTCRMRGAGWGARLMLAGLTWLLAVSPQPTAGADVSPGLRVDVVATGIPRPIQLAFDIHGGLVVLSPGWRGDAAAEIYRIDVHEALPVDATRAPRVVIPFAEELRKAVFGSLALEPRSGDLFLGEENGNRIYRLGSDQRLQAVVVGLNHLLGGSALALDRQGRLVVLDYASPETHLRSESPLPPSLSWLIDEGYRGPLVFRIDPREERPLPRRVDLIAPVLPKTEGADGRREPLWRLIGVAAVGGDDLVFLSSVGEVLRLGPDGDLRLVARLPAGHYHRTNVAVGPDGSVFVCGGFQIRQIFRISPAGLVSTVASELGDPGGIVLDREGALYVAETALHRIIRIAPAGNRSGFIGFVGDL